MSIHAVPRDKIFFHYVNTPTNDKDTFIVIGVHCIPKLSPLGWYNSLASFHIPIFACEATKVSVETTNARLFLYNLQSHQRRLHLLSKLPVDVRPTNLASEWGRDKTGPFWVLFSSPAEIIKLGNPSQVRDQTICRLPGRIPATNFLSSWLFTAFDNAVSKSHVVTAEEEALGDAQTVSWISSLSRISPPDTTFFFNKK